MTVYESFVRLIPEPIMDCPTEVRKSVLEGIHSYLNKMGGAERTEKAEQLAKREWMRFQGISKNSFVSFFANYELRSQIEQAKKECAIMAIHRINDGVQITAEDYERKLSSFYEMASGIVTDTRFAAWLEDITENVTGDLLFAAGRTDRVRHEVVEQAISLKQKAQDI